MNSYIIKKNKELNLWNRLYKNNNNQDHISFNKYYREKINKRKHISIQKEIKNRQKKLNMIIKSKHNSK